MKFYYSLLLVYCFSLLILECNRKQLNKKANIVYIAVCSVLDALKLLLWCYIFSVIFDKRSVELFVAVEFLVQITLAVFMCFIHYTTKNSKTWAEQSLPSHMKRNDSSLDLINWNHIIVSFLCLPKSTLCARCPPFVWMSTFQQYFKIDNETPFLRQCQISQLNKSAENKCFSQHLPSYATKLVIASANNRPRNAAFELQLHRAAAASNTAASKYDPSVGKGY